MKILELKNPSGQIPVLIGGENLPLVGRKVVRADDYDFVSKKTPGGNNF